MNPNKLDHLLSLAKNEEINTYAIDCKTRCLIKNITYDYVTPKASLITVAVLFSIITVFSSLNIYNTHQQQLALETLEKERASFMDTEYLYNTMVASYQSDYEE